MSDFAFRSANCDCTCGGTPCTVPIDTRFGWKQSVTNVQLRGFPSFWNCHEYAPATDANHHPRGGWAGNPYWNLNLTLPDINSAATAFYRSDFEWVLPVLGRVAVDERPALTTADFEPHPRLGSVIAFSHLQAGAWVDVEKRVRTEKWTGSRYSHVPGQFIRRRTGPGAGTCYECTRVTASPVGGVMGDQGADPATLGSWWRLAADPGDAAVRNSYIVGTWDDAPSWGTLGDYKFTFGLAGGNTLVNRFRMVTTEGVCGNPETDNTHFGPVFQTELRFATGPLAMALIGTIGKEYVVGSGWRASTYGVVPPVAPSSMGNRDYMPVGGVVRRLTGGPVSYYRAIADVPSLTAEGDPAASPAFQLLSGMLLPFEDPNLPDQQVVEAIAWAPPGGAREDDMSLPHWYSMLEVTVTFDDVFGYQDGLASVQPDWAYRSEFHVNPRDGDTFKAADGTPFPTTLAAHPLKDPAGVVVGTGSKGTIHHFKASGFNPAHDSYVEWQGDRPKFIRAGEWIDMVVHSDWAADDADANPTFEWRQRWTFRLYAVRAMHYPVAADVPEGTGDFPFQWYTVELEQHYNSTVTGPATVQPAVAMTFQVQDTRTISDVQSTLWPMLSGRAHSFESSPQELVVQTFLDLAWANVAVYADGVLKATVLQNPWVVCKCSLTLNALNSKADVTAIAQARAAAVDLSLLAYSSNRYQDPGSFSFVPLQAYAFRDGNAGVIRRRAAYRYSRYWTQSLTILTSDATMTCVDTPAISGPFGPPHLDTIFDPRGSLRVWNIEIAPPCTGYNPRAGQFPPDAIVFVPPATEGGEHGNGFERVSFRFNQACV
jgi:hypothetical protein